MSEIKFSNKLSDKLGEDRINEVNELSSLVDFKSFLVEMMDANNCSDVIRESVLSKMERLTEVLVKITQINNMHIKNDVKKERIEKELEGLDLQAFKKELFAEITLTDRTLKAKAKEMGQKIKATANEKYASLKQVINDNMNFVSESLKAAKNKESKLKHNPEEVVLGEESPSLEREITSEEKKADLAKKREEVKKQKRELEDKYESISDEKNLVTSTYKSLGFFRTFKNMWDHRKDDPEKKQGFFSIVKNAYKISSENKVKAQENGTKEEIDKLYNEQVETANQIKKLEKDYKELSNQLKTIEKQILAESEACLVECKDNLEKAVAPIKEEEITPSRLQKLSEKIANFGKGLGDKAKAWGEKISNDISTILSYTVDPIIDAIVPTPEAKEKELDDKAKAAKEKAENLKSKAELAAKEADNTPNAPYHSEDFGDDLYSPEYTEVKESLGDKVRIGVKRVKYNNAQRRYKRAEKKSKEAEENLKQYRSARNSGEMER